MALPDAASHAVEQEATGMHLAGPVRWRARPMRPNGSFGSKADIKTSVWLSILKPW